MNIDAILEELSYRIDTGIVDLSDAKQLAILNEIFEEHLITDRDTLLQRIKTISSVLNEETIVKNKKSGNVYTVSKINPSIHDKATPTDIARAKEKNGGKLPTSDSPTTDKTDTKPAAQKKPAASDIDVSAAEKRKDKKETPKAKEVNVERGVAIAVPKQKSKTNGSKKLDQEKAQNRNKYLPPSGISVEKAMENFKKAYPGQVTSNYEYPSGIDKFLKGKLPPAGYDALKSLLKMSKQGVFEPPIGMITDQYGAGQVSAQANELAMQAVYTFPATKDGMESRAKFISSLEQNADSIEKAGGVPILDRTWIKQMAGAHDAFIKNMNREFGEGKWEVTGMTWDVRAQQEALGANYDEKGDSTDINAQIRVDGKEIENIEISCKKDWQIYLLNSGLGDPENWFYTLGSEKEKRANELKTMKDAKDPRYRKAEDAELRQLIDEALKNAPVKNKELQEKQMESTENGFLITKEIPPKDLNSAIKACTEKGRNDSLFIDKSDTQIVKKVAEYLSKTNTLDVDEFKEFLGTKNEKEFKKSVLVYNKVLAEYTGDTDWIDSHKKITYDFMKDAAQKIATDKEFQGMLLRKLQEAIPMKSMVEGIESMQIDGMYITQSHMTEMFGTNNWDSIKEFLTIKIEDGIASIVYLAKGEKQKKPIKLADIDLREKGVGYSGVVGLQCKPTKDFENACREIDAKLNNK